MTKYLKVILGCCISLFLGLLPGIMATDNISEIVGEAVVWNIFSAGILIGIILVNLFAHIRVKKISKR